MRRRSGPPPGVWLVLGGAQRYCAPVASILARRRGLCRRRLAGERRRSRAGSRFTVLRFRFGSAAVSR